MIPKADSLPSRYDSKQAFERIQNTFNKNNESTVYVIADRPGNWLDKDGLQEINRLTATLQNDKIVRTIDTVYTATGIDSPEHMITALKNPQSQKSLLPVLGTYIQEGKLFLPVTLSVRDTSDSAQSWIRKWSKQEWHIRF